MYKLLIAIYLTLPLLISTAIAAEFSMRPGLWEITTSSDLLLLVPHIPSEQMQSIKDFAKNNGFDMPDIDNGAAISQVCITQEMANQKTLPSFYQHQIGCATKSATRNGNSYKVEFSCDGADLTGNGTAEGNLTSAEHFSGQTKFIGLAQGNAVDEKAEISAKWMNASCGTVKPM